MTIDHHDGIAANVDPVTGAYRDPDGPLLAVIAAANAAEPKLELVGAGALIHARYEVPEWRRKQDERAKVTLGEAEAMATVARSVTRGNYVTPDDEDVTLDDAKRRTRRDVGAVIT